MGDKDGDITTIDKDRDIRGDRDKDIAMRDKVGMAQQLTKMGTLQRMTEMRISQ